MKRIELVETILDLYAGEPSFIAYPSQNGLLLLGQIAEGKKSVDTLSERDKGRWKSVVKAYEKWRDENEPHIAETIHEDGTIESDTENPTDYEYETDSPVEYAEEYDDYLNETDEDDETDFKSESGESEPETPADESDEPDAAGVQLEDADYFPGTERWGKGLIADDPRAHDHSSLFEECGWNPENDGVFESPGDIIDFSHEPLHPTPDDIANVGALVKHDGAEIIDGQPELPLDAEEKGRLMQLEAQIENAKQAFDNAPDVIANAAKEIIERRLYRETHKSAGAYFKEKFNITREYAYKLASISGYSELVFAALPDGQTTNLSINARVEMEKQFRKLAEETGLENDYELAIRPIMRDVIQLAVEVVPKDERGNPDFTPRNLAIFGETVRSVVKSKTIEIEGQQMSVEQAHDLGLLKNGFQSQMMETIKESVLANQQTIQDYAKKRYEDKTTPHIPNKRSTSKEGWEGIVPQFYVGGRLCSYHDQFPDNTVTSIGNGTFQTACSCRWQIDSESGLVVCWESEGKRI